ncbi:MAG: TfuA-like core domain-containing protein [Sphingomonas sp.]|nr:TfuA-like core domain-containing protein [Sphingomonas sp.]RZV50958.1 MAG: TfuA-like core domain-containing protein [Sphingomonadaceae bacterium]
MIVFAGPSVPPDLRPADPRLDWRPPAQAGDLLTLCDEPPDRVLLIDGLFDTRPAVTHKECLCLLAAGTTLVGAASMGALRYAELERFGMLGFGQIARQFFDGTLIGDDEVALVHGDARIGWKAISVAMVDVRATLERHPDQVLAKRLLARWHDIHFADRDWPAMIAAAADLADRATLQTIAKSHVPRKQQDALGAIDFALNCRADTPAACPPRTRWVRQLEDEISRRPTRP